MSSTDDPQTTPEVTPRTRGELLAQLITSVHLMREDLARVEGMAKSIATQLAAVVSTTAALTDQIMSLGVEVRKLSDSDEDLRTSVGGLRDGLRNTNRRLHAVSGETDDGGLDP